MGRVTMPDRIQVLRYGSTAVVFPFEGTWTADKHVDLLTYVRKLKLVEEAYPNDSWTVHEPEFEMYRPNDFDNYESMLFDPNGGATRMPTYSPASIYIRHQGLRHSEAVFSKMVYISPTVKENMSIAETTRTKMAKIINGRIHKNSNVDPETIMPGDTCLDCTDDLLAAGYGSKHDTAKEIIKMLQDSVGSDFTVDANVLARIRDAFPPEKS